jgi:acyl-CoA reductase-like NAD-dependent aldehyde dehydrogenase
MDATILDDVTPDMRKYAEESFGPLACAVRASDTENAIPWPTTRNMV